MSVEVELTPGGHYIHLGSQELGWSGIYRHGERLVLISRCTGLPPTLIDGCQELLATISQLPPRHQ